MHTKNINYNQLIIIICIKKRSERPGVYITKGLYIYIYITSQNESFVLFCV